MQRLARRQILNQKLLALNPRQDEMLPVLTPHQRGQGEQVQARRRARDEARFQAEMTGGKQPLLLLQIAPVGGKTVQQIAAACRHTMHMRHDEQGVQGGRGRRGIARIGHRRRGDRCLSHGNPFITCGKA